MERVMGGGIYRLYWTRYGTPLLRTLIDFLDPFCSVSMHVPRAKARSLGRCWGVEAGVGRADSGSPGPGAQALPGDIHGTAMQQNEWKWNKNRIKMEQACNEKGIRMEQE